MTTFAPVADVCREHGYEDQAEDANDHRNRAQMQSWPQAFENVREDAHAHEEQQDHAGGSPACMAQRAPLESDKVAVLCESPFVVPSPRTVASVAGCFCVRQSSR